MVELASARPSCKRPGRPCANLSCSGSVSGLSPKNAIILADLTCISRKMKATFSGDTSGGTLTVSNGINGDALKLFGNYTTASWTLSKDSTGGTRVVDPPVTSSLTADANHGALGGIDLLGIGFNVSNSRRRIVLSRVRDHAFRLSSKREIAAR